MNTQEHYISVRNHTETICKPLNIEDYVVQPAVFTSPVKWHLAHTTWFFETFILKKYLANYTYFNSQFSFLFNSYYNNAGERILRANRGNLTRPTVDEIYKYRAFVDEKMVGILSNNSASIEINKLVVLGLNHEQQHQELLLTDIKYMFGHNPIFPIYKNDYNLLKDTNSTAGFIPIKEGIYQIGYNEDDFCYDNELGIHKVYLNDFQINNALVTNKEFIDFIESDAYSDSNLWLDEGWTWINKNKIDAPLYWHKINDECYYYTLSGLKKIDPNAIVSHINFYEANAFAEWKGMRLPTEFEWEIASKQMDWGKRWEWTSSAYLPYPKYKKATGAVGEYNGKFMSNQMVLRGASVATSKNHSRKTYRNFFHSDERWQFTGIRLVKL
ncbi:MAG: sulfatase maturase [Flavobacteriaceae bacterium]|nr:MAG: sulfatase maturase [Flavobacteriaceae bacterium]